MVEGGLYTCSLGVVGLGVGGCWVDEACFCGVDVLRVCKSISSQRGNMSRMDGCRPFWKVPRVGDSHAIQGWFANTTMFHCRVVKLDTWLC